MTQSDKSQSTGPDQSQEMQPAGCYISTLKHMSSRSKKHEPQNRLIEKLRKCTDMELRSIGLTRAEIERFVYGGQVQAS